MSPDVPSSGRSRKLNIAFIAGTGRCGSTLLDLVLGAHSQIATTGEIHIWPHEISQGGVLPCGCGRMIPECPFWNEMRRRVDVLGQPEPRIHFLREHHTHGEALRPRLMIDRAGSLPDPQTQARIAVYGDNNHSVFQAFSDLMEESTGNRARWILDASKDPYRLLWLIRSGRFRIKVLHCVRDPRGFINSSIRLAGDEGSLWRMMIGHAIRKSLLWVVQNRQIARIARGHLEASDYLLVRYEDLASRPKEMISRVTRFLGVDHEEDLLDRFPGGDHSIAGNPMRHRSTAIVLDESWRRSLPRSCQATTWLVSMPGRSQFGY